ncbi:uncharacterized protein ColSpa_11491 [Colletotrichum spaethianum]|uniref:F-box domain-containing protein n=1 Tax=Colletotrichum spaethianum TaxID=700344 RepID=A0AA37PFW1_9PEZI|nr:uncharacterized protein ColSpa_11491 [Colletotrichum spaethianum]GKT51310.1 hypothetical protein ColSpa_11491 [Colletotrichum spaethianum]
MEDSESLPLEQAPRASIEYLPSELTGAILSQLSNRDIKSLRLTSRKVRDIAGPYFRLDRVFLSANPRNVEVFTAVANHDMFRWGVYEIIWDDARLMKSPEMQDPDTLEMDEEDLVYRFEMMGSPRPRGCPPWYAWVCNENVGLLKRRKGNDVDSRPEHVTRAKQLASLLPLKESYAHYEDLLRQQDEVLSSGADTVALEDAFRRECFPNLCRITITPVAHGFLFTPLYETPMIRSLPYGFNYMIPRSWPVPKALESPSTWLWVDETIKSRWRGFRIVTQLLAHNPGANVTEIVIETKGLRTGLPCYIFDDRKPCKEYDDLMTLLRHPGFARLDLALMVGGQEVHNWSCFRNGRLRHALKTELQHFSFQTDVEPNPDMRMDALGTGGSLDHFTPLLTIFPVETWTRLRHFGLSRFLVKQNDLLDFLRLLPDTLQSVELSLLYFLKDGGGHRGLLAGMRNDLGWRRRAIKPRVAMGYDISRGICVERAVWLDEEVRGFLYGDGENPFATDENGGNSINPGIGIVRDSFEPEHERPYVKPEVLVEMGIIKEQASRMARGWH